jgi:putative CocE/NonD family hydrolase
MGLASTKHPAHVAAVAMGAGAGIGRMGPYYEQGNFYRGGAIQLPMVAWLYGEQNLRRPTFAPDLTREELIRVSRYYDLAPDMPEIDWLKAFRHLPLRDAILEAGGPHGIFEAMADRGPDDPSWYTGGLYHDHEDFYVPALWVNSWYDLSVAPNIALFNRVRSKASERYVRDNQYMIVSPTEHCHTYRLRQPHIVGERNMGDVEFGFDEIVYSFLDYYMKGKKNEFPGTQPVVKYFTMGSNEWQESSQWPPKGAKKLKLFLRSSYAANSLAGDGSLLSEPPNAAGYDQFLYDPSNPVPSLGGNVCCLGDALAPGSFDQRPVESRNDVLVYTSDPLQDDLEVSGPIEVRLFVSSDARDTDFTVKLLDVEPDGIAWNLDESIQRTRYRDGYSNEVFMEPGIVYELQFGPLVTSNLFRKGHRIRVEISSSSYPRFERNLNTGGKNAFETRHVVAKNAVHHAPEHASYIILTTISR